MTDTDHLRTRGTTLHAALLAGDVAAPARIAEAYLPALIERLGRRHPGLDDPHLAATAGEDALLSYLARPAQYDPARLDFFGYLSMSARGDLLNMLGKQVHELENEGLRDVVIGPDGEEQIVETPDDGDLEEEVLRRLSPIWPRLAALFPGLADQEMVRLLMDGVRDTDAYAAVLGILDWPPDGKAREVKRHKDRLRARLRRQMDPAELRQYE